jgi:tetratricopeptide (TPR) repeat protein
VAGSFAKYFSKIVTMMEQIGDILPLYERYEQMFADSVPFREALGNMYFDVVMFLCRARTIFKTNGTNVSIKASHWGTFCDDELTLLDIALKTIAKSAWKPFETEFEDILSALTRHTKILESETTFAHRQTVHLERQRRVMEWLNPVDVENDFQRELEKRAQKTCSWIIENNDYESWKDPQKHDSLLWINGRPGSGKSVLSSSVIEDLQRQKRKTEGVEVIYFFFNENDERRNLSMSVIVNMIAQLTGGLPNLPSNLFTTYQAATKFGRSQISDLDEPMRILASLIKNIPCLYVVLDGLDECKDLNKVIDFIGDFTRDAPNVHLLCSSREIEPLRKPLRGYPTISLNPACTKVDIDKFLEDEIKSVSESLGTDLTNILFKRLSQDAKGNFLWAHLMIRNLKTASSLFELKVMMEKVPQGLVEMYGSILTKLKKESAAAQKLAKKIFMWVCCSTRPLSWAELQTALAVEPEDDELDPSKMPFKGVVLRLCSPVLEYKAEEDVFRPIHFSFCEFFLDPKSYSSKDAESSSFPQTLCTQQKKAHSFITTACLTYLAQSSVAGSVTHDKNISPLVGYATANWCHHLLQSEPGSELQQKLIFFLSSSPQRRIWQTRWLLMGMTSYPLPRLLRYQRAIQTWIEESEFSTGFNFDALEDMFSVLVALDTSPPGYLETPRAGSQIHIGQFEKMMVVRDLTRAYTVTGRLDDARKWLEETLQAQDERHGKDSLESVWILNSLGMIYDQMQLFQLSADIQLQALNIQKEKLPPGHLDAVWTSNELGRVYRHLWNLDEAEKMHFQALKILEGLLPKDDPHVIWTVNCLARTYRSQKKLDEALTLHQRAFASQSQILGPIHPHTLWTLADISRCLRDQEHLLEAYEKQLQVLEGRRKVLGEKHADTFWSMNDVGLLLTQLGRSREAKTYHEKAWAGQKDLLGEEDGMTTWTKNLLESLDIEGKL